MRIIFAVLLIVALALSHANGSTLTAKLVATEADPLKSPGLYDVAIQVQSNGTTSGIEGDGGVSGMRFDILSNGHDLSASVPASSGQFARVKITWNIGVTDFVLLAPQARDAVPGDNPGNPIYDADGDRDGVLGRFFDEDNFIETTVGRSGLQTVAILQWQLSTAGMVAGDNLSLIVTSPTYYDFNSPATNLQLPYTTIKSTGAYLAPVPEPSTFALLALGGIGICLHRSRRLN